MDLGRQSDDLANCFTALARATLLTLRFRTFVASCHQPLLPIELISVGSADAGTKTSLFKKSLFRISRTDAPMCLAKAMQSRMVSGLSVVMAYGSPCRSWRAA